MTRHLLLTACTLLPVVALVIQLAWLGRRGDARAPELEPEEMRRHILWGSFYVNPDDPRGWVPKVSGYGWTVNFRTRGNAVLFALLVCLALAGALLLTWSVLRG